MRILFLHRDFPGAFRHLSHAFGALPDATVLFLSERGRRDLRLPGVRRLRLAMPTPIVSNPISPHPIPSDTSDCRPDLKPTDICETEITLMLRRAARAANAMSRLRKEGFVPDIICGASSDGHSFYARDIFPEALLVTLADWFYTQGDNAAFFRRQMKDAPATNFALPRVRNLCQYNALGDCDLAFTSSAWQKQQYPPAFAKHIHVIHDGIDSQYFAPAYGSRFSSEDCDLTGVSELVTFSFQGSATSRGLPQFFAALPALLARRTQCHVLVMASTSAATPSSRRDMEQELNALSLPAAARKRVHIHDFASLENYRRLLQSSTVHVYMTAPFTLSAGLFEAMSCGCLVAGSDTAPVREVIRHGENGFLFDFWDSDQLADMLSNMLADMLDVMLERSPRLMALREQARKTVLEHYDLATQSTLLRDFILNAWQHHKGASLLE